MTSRRRITHLASMTLSLVACAGLAGCRSTAIRTPESIALSQASSESLGKNEVHPSPLSGVINRWLDGTSYSITFPPIDLSKGGSHVFEFTPDRAAPYKFVLLTDEPPAARVQLNIKFNVHVRAVDSSGALVWDGGGSFEGHNFDLTHWFVAGDGRHVWLTKCDVNAPFESPASNLPNRGNGLRAHERYILEVRNDSYSGESGGYRVQPMLWFDEGE